MMDEAELTRIVEGLRNLTADHRSVEAKRSRNQLPRSIKETLSAFANTHDGLIILGLHEQDGFKAVGVGDAAKVASDLADLARQNMEPALDILIDVVPFEGEPLVVAQVPELPRELKPCYYRPGGIQASWKRVGDGDYKLKPYEIQMIRESRGQPRHDHEPVPEAALGDLDQRLAGAMLSRVGQNRPFFTDLDEESALHRLNVLAHDPASGGLVPTVGGLLALGVYPQQFFPQLNISFVVYPTVDGHPDGDTRFLHNSSHDGPIPVMVREAMVLVNRMMKSSSVIEGVERRTVHEYPEVAIREALVNAVVHRDLSPDSRGTQVQVEMYPDRLTITNPGGLFGPVDESDLGEEGVSSSRNGALLKMLEDVPVPGGTGTVCENRGSGIRAMVQALTAAGMSPPDFSASFSRFKVTFPNHTLIGDEVLVWIRSLGAQDLTDSQVNALAMLYGGRSLTNAIYRTATNIDSRRATAELQDLVSRGLIVQEGHRGGARYLLPESIGDAGHNEMLRLPLNDDGGSGRRQLTEEAPESVQAAELSTKGQQYWPLFKEALEKGPRSRRQIEEATGLAAKSVQYWLSKFRERGWVRMHGRERSRSARYTLVRDSEAATSDD